MLGAGVSSFTERGGLARGYGTLARPFFAGGCLLAGLGDPGVVRRRARQQPALPVRTVPTPCKLVAQSFVAYTSGGITLNRVHFRTIGECFLTSIFRSCRQVRSNVG